LHFLINGSSRRKRGVLFCVSARAFWYGGRRGWADFEADAFGLLEVGDDFEEIVGGEVAFGPNI
jgi:hypothetical protein